MVFTIEPIFTLMDSLQTQMYLGHDEFSVNSVFNPSVQWEHMVYISKDGPEVLTIRENENLSKYDNQVKRILIPVAGVNDKKIALSIKSLVENGASNTIEVVVADFCDEQIRQFLESPIPDMDSKVTDPMALMRLRFDAIVFTGDDKEQNKLDKQIHYHILRAHRNGKDGKGKGTEISLYKDFQGSELALIQKLQNLDF